MLLENMMMAFTAIRANKMRSFLTMLGIIIGIGSVIAIVSIGDTMRAMVNNLYKDVGITRAILYSDWRLDDYRQSDNFTWDEMQRIKEVFADDLDYVDSNSYLTVEATADRSKVKFEFQGIDYNYTDVQEVNIIYGRNLNKADVLGRKANVVVQDRGARKLFGTDNAVGKTFRTTVYGNNMEFKVVGVYKKDLSPFEAMMMGGAQTEAAFIPFTLLTYPNDYIGNLNIFAKEGTNMDALSLRMRQYIAKLHGRQPENIVFYSAIEQMSSMDSMMGSMAMAVGGIAAISLVVGGIGIMNIMLVSVTERTREIGIRKALGARTRDVLIQFLTESAILSACGGVIGILIGVGLVSLGGAAFGMAVVVKPSVIFTAVSFSAAVGIFFGLYPASKAAKADPIDALRYE